MDTTPILKQKLVQIIQDLEPTDWLPQPRAASLRYLSSGAYHQNFVLIGGDQNLVVRTNLSSQWGLSSQDQLSREFAALQDVSASGRTPTPIALVLGNSPFIVETFVVGNPFEYDARSIKMAAAAIAACHAVVPSHSRGLLPNGDPVTDLIQGGFTWLDKVNDAPRFRITERLLRDFGHQISEPRSEGANTIIHTDLIHGNLLIGDDGCGVLDWEGARIGPVEWDLAYFMSPVTTRWADGFKELPSSWSELFLLEYSLAAHRDINDLRARVDSFMPLVVFRALSWCLGYSASTELSDLERTLVERFVDPSLVEMLLRRFHK